MSQVIKLESQENYSSSELERPQKIRQRAKLLLERHKNSGDRYWVEFKNIQLQMTKGVFCPAYGDGSQLLAKYLTVGSGERVLDMGTGSGALAILAAKQGASVTAVDLSPLAVTCARENVKLNNVEQQVKVFQSDLFDKIEAQKFSCILFNPPFMQGKPRTALEMAMYDENYHNLTRFFAQSSDYLLPGGRLLVVFSEAGDMTLFENLAQKSELRLQLVASEVPEESHLELVVYEMCKE
ncbi:methyltransferase [Oscillatoriales cyanobacterium LEGE 11467]|uniref:Methyltransferase n=1 Tax=Zarconia navalis LEGE 11467 TaxID=1828826 RepID=A0A928VSM5_9CYAN|nr:HemK2/MTQ2 family protein methyltransferase [Zarconia navalis]MBE9039396.1 methyltransferase [Zarconia navalis LEGE 11467]